MIMRIVKISLTGAALWALWYGYDNLTVFRRTVFWEFRYIIFTLAAFLGLSAIQWTLDRVQKKLDSN